MIAPHEPRADEERAAIADESKPGEVQGRDESSQGVLARVRTQAITSERPEAVGVERREDEAAAGPQQPGHLAKRGAELAHRLEPADAEGRIEDFIAERRSGAVHERELSGAGRPHPGFGQHLGRHVDADHESGARRERGREATGPGADVEDLQAGDGSQQVEDVALLQLAEVRAGRTLITPPVAGGHASIT